MKRDFSFIKLALWILLPPLWTSYQQTLTIASNLEAVSESPSKSTTIESRISFEKTVFDLGEIGPGTKNECEFRFTNTGRGLLKIGKISRTCGCTVFHLDKKEYAPNEIIHSFQPAYKRPFLWPCGRRQPSLHI